MEFSLRYIVKYKSNAQIDMYITLDSMHKLCKVQECVNMFYLHKHFRKNLQGNNTKWEGWRQKYTNMLLYIVDIGTF